MHIADKVAEELKARGFLPVPVARGGGLRFHRLVESGGAFGKAREIVEICAQGRWLDRRDGWDKIEKEVDLRNFANAPGRAIDEVLK